MISIDPQIVEQLKSRWQPPKVYESGISQKDIEFLLADEADNQPNRILPGRVFGLNKDKALAYLKPFLDSVLEYPYNVTGGNYFRTSVPYILHADTGIDAYAKNYRIVVFPLQITIKEGAEYIPHLNSFTVMNQRWFHQAAFFMKGQEEKFNVKKAEYNQPVNDYSLIEGTVDSKINRERFDEYYDHMHYDNFEGMSEHTMIQWTPGNVMTFDRNNIHTATNFLKANVEQKIGLTFFTEYADL